MALTTMSKITFWNTLRVERNIRYCDIAELFGGGVSTYGAYFSGQLMPKDDIITKLCDLFDVDFDKGKEEFRKAHADWVSTKHSGRRELTTGKKDVVLRASAEMPARVTVGQSDSPSKSDIFSLIYGKIPYDRFSEFCDMVASKNGDPLKLVYGAVSYEDYNEIARILGEDNAN